jgi:hypothetical protein
VHSGKVKKEDVMADTKSKKFPEDGIQQFGELYSLLYICMAKEFEDSFGKEGEEALRRAIRNFGHQRGRRLRERHEAEGLPITVKTLFEHYDLPPDNRFRRNPIELTDYIRYSETLVCPYTEIWSDHGLSHLGVIYCMEFHQAMWEAYISDIIVELPKTLTKGNEKCRFEVYRKGHKKNIPDPAPVC